MNCTRGRLAGRQRRSTALKAFKQTEFRRVLARPLPRRRDFIGLKTMGQASRHSRSGCTGCGRLSISSSVRKAHRKWSCHGHVEGGHGESHHGPPMTIRARPACPPRIRNDITHLVPIRTSGSPVWRFLSRRVSPFVERLVQRHGFVNRLRGPTSARSPHVKRSRIPAPGVW